MGGEKERKFITEALPTSRSIFRLVIARLDRVPLYRSQDGAGANGPRRRTHTRQTTSPCLGII